AEDGNRAGRREEVSYETRLIHFLTSRGRGKGLVAHPRRRIIAVEMPPRAPVVWTTTAVRSERFRQRLDERHRELTIHAKARGRSYRRSRADPVSEEIRRLRADFIAALGRLGSFEIAMSGVAQCRYEIQLNQPADALSPAYFQPWPALATPRRARRP